jgi:molecular chaperone DnaK (HSP70)
MSNVLKEAEVEPVDIDEVILVGGSTRIPILRSKISEAFDGKVSRSLIVAVVVVLLTSAAGLSLHALRNSACL